VSVSKQSFFEKKDQKTFLPQERSFLLLFFKKEDLSFLIAISSPTPPNDGPTR
jgi:hypothetical protein